jgi:hypothetical protein
MEPALTSWLLRVHLHLQMAHVLVLEQGGFSAGEMLNHVPGIDGARRERLIKVLDIDPDWQMNKVSDGQRRRVQIAIGLLRPFKVAVLCADPFAALIWSVVSSSSMFMHRHNIVAWHMQVLLLDEVTVDLDVLGKDLTRQAWCLQSRHP